MDLKNIFKYILEYERTYWGWVKFQRIGDVLVSTVQSSDHRAGAENIYYGPLYFLCGSNFTTIDGYRGLTKFKNTPKIKHTAKKQYVTYKVHIPIYINFIGFSI